MVNLTSPPINKWLRVLMRWKIIHYFSNMETFGNMGTETGHFAVFGFSLCLLATNLDKYFLHFLTKTITKTKRENIHTGTALWTICVILKWFSINQCSPSKENICRNIFLRMSYHQSCNSQFRYTYVMKSRGNNFVWIVRDNRILSGETGRQII